MSAAPSPPASPEVDSKTVIGIAFGNTNSSIAYTTPVCLARLFSIFVALWYCGGRVLIFAGESIGWKG